MGMKTSDFEFKAGDYKSHISVKVSGLDELQAVLERMEKKSARRILFSAAKKGGAIFKEAIKQLVPADTGTLRDSIHMRWFKPRGDMLAGSMIVGPDTREEPKSGMRASQVASWLEFGHGIGKDRSHGYVSPNPFMTQAFHLSFRRVQQAVIAEIKRLLDLGEVSGEDLPNEWNEPGAQRGSGTPIWNKKKAARRARKQKGEIGPIEVDANESGRRR